MDNENGIFHKQHIFDIESVITNMNKLKHPDFKNKKGLENYMIKTTIQAKSLFTCTTFTLGFVMWDSNGLVTQKKKTKKLAGVLVSFLFSSQRMHGGGECMGCCFRKSCL